MQRAFKILVLDADDRVANTLADLLPPGLSLGEAVASYERRLIMAALARSEGVQRQAARLLGMRPTTLNEKIKRLGLRTGENPS